MTFSFGDIDLSPHVLVTDVTRSIAPRRRLVRAEVPGMDGELVRADGLEAAEVTVTGHLARRGAEGVASLRRVLARMAVDGRPQRLRLPDEPQSYLMALYEGGAQLSRASRLPKVELAFLAADPVARGQAREQDVSGEAPVDAGGTYPARPVVTAKPPPGSSWKIANVDTGEFVLVRADFDGSQTLVLDMGLQRCTVNGADHAVDVSSDFFAIDGMQTIKVSGGTAALEWEERWV